MKADTRKLSSFEAFQKGISEEIATAGTPDSERTISLRSFAEQRRAYLLKSTGSKPPER